MVFEYTCPFCGDKFKVGYDPVKSINYPDYSIEISREKLDPVYDIKSTNAQICEKCYDKMVGEIKITERRIKSEQYIGVKSCLMNYI